MTSIFISYISICFINAFCLDSGYDAPAVIRIWNIEILLLFASSRSGNITDQKEVTFPLQIRFKFKSFFLVWYEIQLVELSSSPFTLFVWWASHDNKRNFLHQEASSNISFTIASSTCFSTFISYHSKVNLFVGFTSGNDGYSCMKAISIGDFSFQRNMAKDRREDERYQRSSLSPRYKWSSLAWK